MKIKLISFGFHYGIPENLDAIFDARGIKNPHNNKKLRKLTGLDKAVQDDVFSSAGIGEILSQIAVAIARSRQKGKDEVTLGIGCSFGHHRSVALVEAYKDLSRALGNDVTVEHRDLSK